MSATGLLRKNWRQVVYSVLMLVTVLTSIIPTARLSPTGVDWYVQNAFNTIQGLKPGDAVYVENCPMAMIYGAFYAGGLDVLYHLFTRPGVKVIFASFWDSGSPPILSTQFLPYIEKSGKVYGTDYALFPFYTGFASGVAAMASNVKGILTVDYYGTPSSRLPVMKDINTGADFKLVIILGRGQDFVRAVWAPQYKVNIVSIMNMANLPAEVSWMRSGIYGPSGGGGVYDVQGAAQYEILLDRAGLTRHSRLGAAAYTSVNAIQLYMLLLLVFGNVYALTYLRKRKGE